MIIAVAAAVLGSLLTAVVMSGSDVSGPGPSGAASATKTGGACPKGMTRVPAGDYLMGVMDGGAADEGPQRRVSVGSFCLDVDEVTVEGFAACVKAGKCSDDHLSEWSADGENFAPNPGCNWNVEGKQRHPINCVDSRDAQAYCGFIGGGRLPTEAEWEWAARGGDEGRTYPWGHAPPRDQLCWRGDGDSEGKGKRTTTCEVGTHAAGDGRFGQHDLGGNLWEWTSSRYCPYSGEPCTDEGLVSRGASLVNDTDFGLRVTRRSRELPTHRLFYLGFRCAHD